ncbi:MAG: T9SS type A sorting domain-containing protein [Bacteroidales bacterium]|nr:T9SS type A sorting domain-containing protein [Bacteroidales bacterium]
MKNLIVISLFVSLNILVKAQFGNEDLSMWSFEYGTGMNRISFDPDTIADYSWKIGKPDKTYFTEAYSKPNAICTELDTSYSKSDTISFTLKHYAMAGFEYAEYAILSGHYKVDCDSLNDYGLIEISFDNGNSWIDIFNNNEFSDLIDYYSPKPALTGRSDWTLFAVNLAKLGPYFDIVEGDSTIRIRFSFISDSIENFREGLMFDEIFFEDYTTSIKTPELLENHVSLYPNPAHTFLKVEIREPSAVEINIQILDITGRVVFHDYVPKPENYQIDVAFFRAGIYNYLVTYNSEGKNRQSFGKFIVIR